MTLRLHCRCGHAWEAAAPDGATVAGGFACPRCGAATQPAPAVAVEPDSDLATVPGLPSACLPAVTPAAAGPDRRHLSPPDVPGYEILGELGRGGMGVVYKARDQKLNRVVALKMILEGVYAGAAELARFRAEAEAIAQLQHPNIIQVFGAGEHGGHPYIALEFCPGGSLAARLDGTPWQPADAAALVRTLAGAVEAAHRARIVHRDLKPGNVLLQDAAPGAGAHGVRAAVPKVTDFGLAKRLDDGGGRTASGAVLGTPSYMAPEQARGDAAVGPAADVYALGAILYELLTGRPPFKAATPWDTVAQVVRDDPLPPRRLQPQVPRDLETVCLKCLRKDPAARYPVAAELADDLGRYLDGRPVRARPVPPLERGLRWCRRRPALAALAVVSFAAALLLVGVAVSRSYSARLEETLAEVDRQRGEAVRLRGEAESQRDRAERLQGQLSYAAGFRAAFQDWERGQLAEARGRLAALDPALRGFEWHHLRRAVDSPGGLHTLRHGGFVEDVAFSPDGGAVATASRDGTVRLWGLDGRELRRWDAGGGATHAAFTPDGGQVVAATSAGEVVVFDAAGRGVVRRFRAHPGELTGFALSPDGGRLATAWHAAGPGSGNPAVLRLWDLATGELVREVLPAGGARGVAFSPDGRSLASCGTVVQLWDAAAGECTGSFLFAENMGHSRVAYAPDGRTLAVGDQEGRVRLWDLAAGRPGAVFRAHRGAVRALAFAGAGRFAASGGQDNTVRLWDLRTGEEAAAFRGHTNGVHAVAVSPDGGTVASAAADRTAVLWDRGRGSGPEVWAPPAAPVNALAVTPDGRTLITGGGELFVTPDDGTTHAELIAWDLGAGRPARVLQPFPEDVHALTVSPDGARLAVALGRPNDASGPGRVELWDLPGRRLRHALEGHTGPVWDLAFSPDGKTLASAGGDLKVSGTPGEVRLWDTATGRNRRTFAGPEVPCISVAFSGGRLAVGNYFGGWRGLDPATGGAGPALPDRLHLTAACPFAETSPDGGLVATSRMDRAGPPPPVVEVWETATGRRRWSLEGHRGLPVCAAFAPDGRLLATGGYDREVRVWDVGTGKVRKVLRGHGAAVMSAAFAPDGRTLVTGAGEGFAPGPGEVKQWDLAAGGELASWPAPASVMAVAFTPDGGSFLAGTADGGVSLYPADGADPQPPAPLRRPAGGGGNGHAAAVTAAAVAPDGRTLAAGDAGGGVKLWDLHTGAVRRALGVHTGPVRCAAFAADGRTLATATGALEPLGGAGEVIVWDVAAGRAVRQFPVDEPGVSGLALTPDGRVIWGVEAQLVGGPGEGVRRGQIMAAEWGSDRPPEKIAPAEIPHAECLALSPDGRTLAVGIGTYQIKLFDTAAWRPRATLAAHSDVILSLAFSPDGKTLASSSKDGTVRLWQAATGLELCALRGMADFRVPVAFAPDGRALVAAGGLPPRVHVWRAADPGAEDGGP